MKYLKLSISKNFSMNFFWKLLKGNQIMEMKQNQACNLQI